MYNFLLLVLIVQLRRTMGFVGYDCGSGAMNVTTVSILNVGACDIPPERINSTNQFVQLFQTVDFSRVEVIQCKINVKRTIHYCGMHSHVSIVHNGEADYLNEVTVRGCDEMHRMGYYQYLPGKTLYGIKINRTTTTSVTFAGSATSGGDCKGASYADPYGSWNDVVVQGTLHITLKTQFARVNLDENKIIFASGTTCTFTDKFCIDSEYGYSFWHEVSTGACNNNKNFGLVFEGFANKTVALNIKEAETLYSIRANESTFALRAQGIVSLCGMPFVKTDHPKLFIYEGSIATRLTNYNKLVTEDLDIFAYVNSKFVYVERHIRTEVNRLYRDVVTQRCKAEREILKNKLSIATQSADEFAYNFMDGPGYLAVLAGEVVHIVKCIPVEVTILHLDTCYNELPVRNGNRTLFLTPRTHILKEKGTVVDCNPVMPAHYFINGNWYKILPRPTEAITPVILTPSSEFSWIYRDIGNLNIIGLYTLADLELLRKKVMYPVEKGSYINDLVREMNGQTITSGRGALLSLLNEEALAELARSTWSRVWSSFINFGTVSAGLIAIYAIIQVLKTLLDVIIRGYTLHTIYGWSVKLLAAIWGTMYHCLLSRQPEIKIYTNPSSRTPTTPDETPSRDRRPREPTPTNFRTSVDNRSYDLPRFEDSGYVPPSPRVAATYVNDSARKA